MLSSGWCDGSSVDCGGDQLRTVALDGGRGDGASLLGVSAQCGQRVGVHLGEPGGGGGLLPACGCGDGVLDGQGDQLGVGGVRGQGQGFE